MSAVLDRKEELPRGSYARWGLAGWLIYVATVLAVHYGAWVPLPMVAAYASPSLVLPMMVRWIHHSPPGGHWERANHESRENKLALVIEQSLNSPMIRIFRERYPRCRAYLYHRDLPYSAGGVLMQNRVRLRTPRPVYLEVTLDCPFGARVGAFLEGHEVLQAYLFREQEDGIRMSFLPARRWDQWLQGMRTIEWFKRIGEIDRVRPRWPRLGDLPYFLVTEKLDFQRITLR